MLQRHWYKTYMNKQLKSSGKVNKLAPFLPFLASCFRHQYIIDIDLVNRTRQFGSRNLLNPSYKHNDICGYRISRGHISTPLWRMPTMWLLSVTHVWKSLMSFATLSMGDETQNYGCKQRHNRNRPEGDGTLRFVITTTKNMILGSVLTKYCWNEPK